MTKVEPLQQWCHQLHHIAHVYPLSLTKRTTTTTTPTMMMTTTTSILQCITHSLTTSGFFFKSSNASQSLTTSITKTRFFLQILQCKSYLECISLSPTTSISRIRLFLLILQSPFINKHNQVSSPNLVMQQLHGIHPSVPHHTNQQH